MVHAADIQDRDGAPALLASIRSAFPWLRHVFADGGYAWPKLTDALAKLGNRTMEIVTHEGKQIVLRTPLTGTVGKVFQATRVALPPVYREVAPAARA